MLGYGVCTFLGQRKIDFAPLSRRDFDIVQDPLSKLEDYLRDVSIVINCAGVIKPMIAGTAIESVLKVNTIFPRNLARLCVGKSIRCFHITTDCAFSGRKGGYTEDDVYDPEDVYGLSKAAGEPTDCMTLRTSIIGEEKEQARSLLSWAISQKGKEVMGFTNHYWNGLTTTHFARIIERIISGNLYRRGIYHVFSPGRVSKYELLGILNDIYDLSLKITPVEADSPCDRTLSSIHDLSTLLCQEPIREQVVEMKEIFARARRS